MPHHSEPTFVELTVVVVLLGLASIVLLALGARWVHP